MRIHRRDHLKQLLAGSVGLSLAGLTVRTLEAAGTGTAVTHHPAKAKW